MILLKEQYHRYLQSTPKSGLTYSTIVELDLNFLIQSIDSCQGTEVNWGYLPGLTASTNSHFVCSITLSTILTQLQIMMVYPDGFLGPVQTPLHSCAEPNWIRFDFGATLARQLIQTAYCVSNLMLILNYG